MQPLQDIHIRSIERLISPRQCKQAVPLSDTAARTVATGRQASQAIIQGSDPRLMVIVGPCSIHDPKAAMEYAHKLASLAKKIQDSICVMMRVYFEKPRTTVGWKGLINDPHLDDTFDISTGLKLARQILLDIAELGLPAATELLDPITPQYIADLISVGSIGARTTESPTHRQMASGLSMPVGFKNGTDGSLEVAINAIEASRHPHSFLGIDTDGQTCIVQTKGNPFSFMILRGGRSGPNYASELVQNASAVLRKSGLIPDLVVDCSHANSDKDHRRQSIVWKDVVEQRAAGNTGIMGVMLESNLLPGSQKLTKNTAELKYGVSITDACIGWDETEELLLWAHERLSKSNVATV